MQSNESGARLGAEQLALKVAEINFTWQGWEKLI